jgi:hypothetical protein
MDTPARIARIRPPANPCLECSVKKAKALPHRNRGKSARHRAKLKSKHKRVRLRKSSGERKTYR